MCKKVFVIHPPMEKYQEAKTIAYEFKSEKSYEQFMNRHKAELKNDNSEMAALSLDDLQDGQVYRFVGPLYTAVQSDQVRRKVDDKVLEMESALAVQKALGGKAHVHCNVTFNPPGSKQPALEIDAIVHDGADDPGNVAIYIVEAAYAPQPNEVEVLKSKIERVRPFLQEDDHFRGVARIIPVLGGRHWSHATIAACGDMLRVAPCGNGYAVHGIPEIPSHQVLQIQLVRYIPQLI